MMLGTRPERSDSFTSLHLKAGFSPFGELGVISAGKGIVTLCCPEVSAMTLPVTIDTAPEEEEEQDVSRKRSSSSTTELSLSDSNEHLLSSSGLTSRALLRKLIRLREKLVATEALNLKRRLLAGVKRKRKVSFADDKGLPLADVCVVEGDDVEETAAQDGSGSEEGDCQFSPWIMAFYQPIFDKRRLQRTFTTHGVALETVDVEENQLSGTIKVSSSRSTGSTGSPRSQRRRKAPLVFVRYTRDSWKTFSDVEATAVPSYLDRSRADDEMVYTFDIDLPDTVLHVQFAVCAVADDGGDDDGGAAARWDKNDGANYVLLHRSCLESDSGSETEDSDTKL